MSSYESLPGQGGDFAKGASGADNVYDTSPAGLGLSPSYLAGGATATASASLSTSVITGVIPAAGTTPTAGTGFTYTHGSTGVYVFTFTTAFSAVPIVLAVPIETSRVFSPVSAITVNGFTVTVLNAAGTAVDDTFNFLAVGVQ